MPDVYRHTQRGTSIVVLLSLLIGLFAVIAAWVTSKSAFNVVFAITFSVVAIVVVVALLVFSRLNVAVTTDAVTWAFGAGFPRYSVPLREIQRVEIVHTPWWVGTGIRVTPRGMLYNVGGREAVELTLQNRRVLIGSDEPAELARAIDGVRGAALS